MAKTYRIFQKFMGKTQKMSNHFVAKKPKCRVDFATDLPGVGRVSKKNLAKWLQKGAPQVQSAEMSHS